MKPPEREVRCEREYKRHETPGDSLTEVIEKNRPGLYYLFGTAVLSAGVALTYSLGRGLMALGFLLLLVSLLELNAEEKSAEVVKR